MDDLISRQAAIDAITDERIVSNMDSVLDTELHRCKRAMQRILASLPSAQPKRKRGKWTVIEDSPDLTFDPCKCSECGAVEYFTKGWKKFNYCPNCGAEMKGENNG